MDSSSIPDSGELPENDDMGSLFEGMVLFTTPTSAVLSDSSSPPPPPPPRDDDDTDHHHNKVQTIHESHDSLSLTSSPYPPTLPLDENLFADLTLMVDNPHQQHILEEPSPSPSSASATLLISLSRKKKRAAGLRIGYGRDRDRDQDIFSNDNDQVLKDQDQDRDDHPQFSGPASIPIENSREQKQHPAAAAASSSSSSLFQNANELEQATLTPTTATIDIRFEQIRALIEQKLNTARQAVSSVSVARNDSIRKRRKAVHLLSDASAKYLELERQLEEACEAEDFERADGLGDSLASLDKDRELLQIALRDAEAHSDDIESKMREALEYQIQA